MRWFGGRIGRLVVRVTDFCRSMNAVTFVLTARRGSIGVSKISTAGLIWLHALCSVALSFENEDIFAAGFPTEFVPSWMAYGWFYTLTVLGAALFDKPAFRNVIVNGMVMAEDGKKMSKNLRNYTPPMS